MKPLEPPDSHHLNAAVGWLGLGSAEEAQLELDLISVGRQLHPEVLETSWLIRIRQKRWRDAVAVARAELAMTPENCSGWLHHAYALRRAPGGGVSQAWEALLPAAQKFPREPVVAYNLSCYACQMQQLDVARLWLHRAIKIGGKDTIRKMALVDDDLQPLWEEIRSL